jgi:protein transport protein SEC24
MVATYYLKDTIDKLYKTKNIANSIISTDTQFKQFIDKVMSTQNKIEKDLLPNLDYLPLYMIGMFKHRIFCKEEIEKNYDIDISNFLRISLQKLSPQEIISFIVPSVYSLHDLEEDKTIGTYNQENGLFNMPNLISSSKSAMEDNGLYLIDNGYMLIIYVKKNVSSNIFMNLFGVENLSFLTMIINEDNVFDENSSNEFKERIKNILDYIRGGKSIYQNLVFVFEGEGGERIINESLIEDNFCKWFPMDYSSFYKKYIKGNSSFGY